MAEAVQSVPEEESAGEKLTGEFAHTTQQIGKLFADMGGKAKGLWNQMKEKQSDRAASRAKEETEADEEAVELEIPQKEIPAESAGTQEENPPAFTDQIPGPESAEELAKRTGWSDETIKDFFAGLDLDMTEAESDKDPNEN